MGMLGGVDSQFTYRVLIMAVVFTTVTPLFMSAFYDVNTSAISDMESDYRRMTGSDPVSEEVWALTGIYTPYSAGATYGYTSDGWLYHDRIGGTYAGKDPTSEQRTVEAASAYAPTQYTAGLQAQSYYSVAYDGTVYRYTGTGQDGSSVDSTQDGHSRGDVYTMVTMDSSKKSRIFFAEGTKVDGGNGTFYYAYEGYRYAFTPLTDTVTVSADGESVSISSQQTTMSLIWYSYYGNEGLSGQLVLNSSDGGIAYLTAAQIISAYNSQNNTAKFTLTFNGVDINCYIMINPTYTSMGYSISDCFYNGYWSVMITSLTTNSDSFLATDFSLNVSNLWETVIGLLTFDYSNFGIDGDLGVIATLFMVVPMYLGLIVIGMSYAPVLILTGLLGAFQALAVAMQHWSFF